MAFCKYCGASIPEGGACTCAQSQAAAAQTAPQSAPQGATAQQAAAAQATVVNAAKNVTPYLTEYFVNPANAVRRVVEQDNLTMAIALTVIRVLAVGLTIYGLLRKLCSMVMSLGMAAAGAMGAFGGSAAAEMAGTSIKAPLMGSLLWGGLIALVGMALFILMVFALVKLQHGTVSLKAVFEASAANGILTSALLLVAFLLSFVSLKGCMAFIALACISWMISGVLTAQLLCPDNASGKFWLLYFVGVVLVLVIGYYVMPSLILRAVGGISITVMGVTQTLQSGIDMAKAQLAQMGGFSGILKEMLYDMF